MTTIPKPSSLSNSYTCAYDAWNRLVEVKDGQTTIGKYEYDGLRRRAKSHVDSAAPANPDGVDLYRHFYYNALWQLLETRRSTSENSDPEILGATVKSEWQFVWSLRYIDSPVLRDRNADLDPGGSLGKASSGLEQRMYYATDANMNVTALINTDGTVAERYRYDAYGTVTVLDADWSTDADNKSDYDNPILYCGYHRDSETGLYSVRYRVYHAPLGRWMQRDPIGYADAVNLLQYALSQPTDLADPTGTMTIATKVEWILVYRTLPYLQGASMGALYGPAGQLGGLAAGGVGRRQLNWLVGRTYDINDDEGEMMSASEIVAKIDAFYEVFVRKETSGDSGGCKPYNVPYQSAKVLVGQFRMDSPGPFSTGWWLTGSHDVYVEGRFEACKAGESVRVRNRATRGTWHDAIDAKDFENAKKAAEKNPLGEMAAQIEGTYHVIADHWMDIWFYVDIHWQDSR